MLVDETRARVAHSLRIPDQEMALAAGLLRFIFESLSDSRLRGSIGPQRAISKVGTGFAIAIKLAQIAYTYLRVARQLLSSA